MRFKFATRGAWPSIVPRTDREKSNKVFPLAEVVNNTAVRTLAIGDIHGCLNSLRALTQFASLNHTDRLILLGDYVDRGPDSRGVIDWILETTKSTEVITLIGNHEELMMTSKTNVPRSHFWSSVGGVEALNSYETNFTEDWAKSIPESHWEFLEQTRLYFETEKHIFVHGMVDADRSMAEQDSFSMKWERCFGMKPHKSGKPVICGHTAHADGNIGVYDFGFCIDTAACGDGWLTCLNPDTGEFWQANEEQQTRSGKLENV